VAAMEACTSAASRACACLPRPAAPLRPGAWKVMAWQIRSARLCPAGLQELRPAMVSATISARPCGTGKWRRRRRGSTWILCPEADSMASAALPCTPSPTARPFPYSASTDIETQQHGSRRPQSPGIEPIPLGTRN
jgi:hypothetical protein